MESIFLAIGIIIGIIIGIVIDRLITKSHYQAEISGATAILEGKIKYAEGQVDEMKAQISRATEDFSKLRVALDEEKSKSVEMVTRLEESNRNLSNKRNL